MSFASEVREELCRILPEKRCCRFAECYGILLFCNTFAKNEIKIVTESRSFAELLPRLFRRTFGLDFDQFPSLQQPGKLTFIIDDPEKLDYIFSVYGQEHPALALHVNFAVLEDECCRQSFMRGAFLAGGSVTDPDKRYHLELVTSHQKVSDESYQLLLEMGFSPLDAQRGGSRILYFKRSDMIVDYLTAIGAPVCARSCETASTAAATAIRPILARRSTLPSSSCRRSGSCGSVESWILCRKSFGMRPGCGRKTRRLPSVSWRPWQSRRSVNRP